nr:MAG TPA: hypothetical protein [Caudoviricetes sp.]
MSKHIRYFLHVKNIYTSFLHGSSLIRSERLRHITLVDHDRSTRDL